MTLKNFTLAFFSLLTFYSYGQLTIDAELRPRFEYRHGYKTLIPDDTDAAMFISQRTRLNTKFNKEKYTFFLSFQDIRTWGDTKQLAENASSLAIHQAWAKVKFCNTFGVKLGRQEVIYDDSRIFGNVGWAQQARSHDMALAQFADKNYKLDIGFAYNQDAQNLTGNLYTQPSYKAFQYAWYHNKFGNVDASFLLLNNGMQYIDVADDTKNEIRYSQTIGTHLKFKLSEKIKATTNLYYQTGKDVGDNNLSAYLAGIDLGFKVSEKSNIGIGVEIQSGNDYDETDKNREFTPFYGTNHKFNGWMDYFYVGPDDNTAGLIDIYGKFSTKLNEKSSLTAFIHNFNAAAEIGDDIDKQLGTEIDLVYKYNFSKDVNISAGFSQMFASDGLEAVKGNTDGNSNNWGWLMVTIKPQLFSK